MERERRLETVRNVIKGLERSESSKVNESEPLPG